MKDSQPGGSKQKKQSVEAYAYGKRNSQLGVSFGRRVNPVTDRKAERRLIIERRRHIDALIAGGLKSAGIELDPEEKRLQQLMQSTATTF